MSDDEIKKTFDMFDADGDGVITADEVRKILEQTEQELSEEDVEQVIRDADSDGDGRISFDEFVRSMKEQ